MVFHAADFITNTFTNIYLWEQTKSLITIASYNMLIFAALPFAALIGCFIAQRISVKIVYYLGIIFYILQCLIVLIYKENLALILFPFGFVSAMAIGFQAYAYNLITEETTKSQREEFYGIHGSMLNLLGLILPVSYTLLITKLGSFDYLFFIALVLFIVLGVVFFVFPIIRPKTEFKLVEILRIPSTNPDKPKIFWLKFLAGIQSGLSWSIMGLVFLAFLDNLVKWGIFTALLTLLSIVGCYVYGKNVDIKTSKYYFTAIALLYAFSCIVLVVNFSFISFLFFLIVNTLLGVAMSVNFDAIINDLIEEDTNIINLKEEYHALLEIPLAVGRMLPVAMIILFGIQDASNVFLRLIFLILAPIPLYMMWFFVKTKAGKAE